MNFVIVIFLAFVSAELSLVIEISKEGQRTPSKNFPWGLKEDPSILSSQGFDKQYQIGQKIKEKYYNLIHPYYTDDDILARSCNSSSCISSIKAQLEGIYGKSYNFKINFTQEADDFLFRPQDSCPRIRWLMTPRLQSKDWQEIWKKVLSHSEKYKKFIGNDIDIQKIYGLGEALKSYKERKIDFPSELTKEEAEIAIEAYYRFHDTVIFASIEQGILATNEMMINLFRSINYEITKPSQVSQKFHIYLGDDAWYMAIMRTLGMDFSPSAASALFIELHRIDDDKKIRFWQENSYVEVPGCGLECDFRDFEDIITNRNFKPEHKHRKLCMIIGEIEENGEILKYALIILSCLFVSVLFKFHEQLSVWVQKKFKSE
ncbi:unnamed protein product [Blepharisma stoltei]|uniref:Uncharacterized protein n=1 Tax=Blepharisma stoltei TaxID=1481888 RepID=A0AAU9IYG4_9CILI|nr:unnamed protein product [Blepharisma stoltei]